MRRFCDRSKLLSNFLALAFTTTVPASPAAQTPQADLDFEVPVGFVIIKSTTSYAEALKLVQEASSKSQIPIDLRGVILDPNVGLTYSEEKFREWQDWLYQYPWYFARGRHDGGLYLSIERSDSYESFSPGFFIVIAASGPPESTLLIEAMSKVEKLYPDAYTKVATIWYGCMH
jgi:hypothetical protein